MADPASMAIGADAIGIGLGVSGAAKTVDTNASMVNGLTSSMNGILSNSLNNALGSTATGTNQAVATQNSSLANANAALQTGQTNSANTSSQGLNLSNALASPYSMAGLNALDIYEGTLGVARPTMGNYNYQQAAAGLANAAPTLTAQQAALKSTGAAAGASNIFSTPVAPTQVTATPMTNAQLAAQINQVGNNSKTNFNSGYQNGNTNQANWYGNPWSPTMYSDQYLADRSTAGQIGGNVGASVAALQKNNPNLTTDQLLAQDPAYAAAMNAKYNVGAVNAANATNTTNTNNYNAYNSAFNNLNTTLGGLNANEQTLFNANPNQYL